MNKYFDFLGSEVSGVDRDRVYVIPVPIEWSTSYGKGTASAPEAILHASLQIELYHPTLDIDLEGAGIVTLRPQVESKEDLIAFVKEHRSVLRKAFVCFIGGEHSITPWILEGLSISGIGIVWLDAHADLRESYLDSRESHACAARNSIPFGKIVEIGVRSFSKGEREYLARDNRIKIFSHWNEEAREAVRRLPDSVYLSLDYDVLDPSIIRSVGTPEPGGLEWDDLMDLLTFLFREKHVVAMDAVELCPVENDETSNFIGAKVIYEAVSRFLRREVRHEE